MNWEAIGAIGELLGAAAVVATLLYLARQTAENARAVRAGAARQANLAEAQWHGELASNPELKRIFNLGVKIPMHDFTDEEWTEFRFLAMRTFLQFEVHHMDRTSGTGIDDQNLNRLSIARGLIEDFPAFQQFWDRESSNKGFSASFIEAVNGSGKDSRMSHIASSDTSSGGA